VIAGDPVCDPADAATLISAVRRRSLPRPVFAYAATPALRSAWASAGFGAVPIGAEPVFDPRRFTLAGGARATVRAAVNHATRSGLSVVEHHPRAPGSDDRNAELEDISTQWLAGKGRDELGFLLGQPQLNVPTAKRYFVAAGERVEGFLVCEPIWARQGWYLDVTRRRPDAPRGTMELLVAETLRTLGSEGVPFASMGLSPLARLDADAPPSDSPRLSALLSEAFGRLTTPYDFRDLARYQAKFAPDAWEHRLLCYSGAVAERLARFALERALRQASVASPRRRDAEHDGERAEGQGEPPPGQR
jgi:phosphatidylglycerol lysyltransferase